MSTQIRTSFPKAATDQDLNTKICFLAWAALFERNLFPYSVLPLVNATSPPGLEENRKKNQAQTKPVPLMLMFNDFTLIGNKVVVSFSQLFTR